MPAIKECTFNPPSPFGWSALFRYEGECAALSPHSHGYFQFIYVFAGEIRLETPEGGVFSTKSGDLSVLAPEIPHLWRSLGPETRSLCFLCGCCSKELHGEIASILAPWVKGAFWSFPFPREEAESLRNALKEAKSSTSPMKETLLYAQHMRFLAKACEAFLERFGLPERAALPEPALRALELMDSSYMKPLSLEALASRSGLSPSRFSELFRKAVGKPPMRCLNELRVRKAETLLLHEREMRIEEVARRCGFSSQHYFCRLFKKLRSVGPLAFRARSL